MATHILTVNETTFQTHLKYMFIGTGRDGFSYQNGALADILSIREGDYIIFYVMNIGFFGIFKAIGNVFYDFNSYVGHHPQYLDSELNSKTLTYRMKIQGYKVYKYSISEWDMMENPTNIKNQSIYNMQWSWIFKKLNGNRGCLSIDNYEFDLFEDILQQNNQIIPISNNYAYNNQCIEILNNDTIYNRSCISETPRDNDRLYRIEKEEDLRILFTAKAGIENLLNQVLRPESNGNINLISNEILCSFSERKMDLLFGTDQNKCILIELKNKFIFNENIYNQIKEYSRWISAYKTHYISIIPILIIREARIISRRSNAERFKYLSDNNMQDNIVSPWYQDILDQIDNAKNDLINENIDKLEELQVFIFSTDDNNQITSFEIV